MIKKVVGARVYNVWLEMLKVLVPGGRTHRIAPVVGSMLQYTFEMAQRKSNEDRDASIMSASFIFAFKCNDTECLKTITGIVEDLFKDAGVRYLRKNSRGDVYNIAENCASEFVNWNQMPWQE